MKTVTTHAGRLIAPRQGETRRHARQGGMKRRVETGHLRQSGPARGDRPDRREVVGLVERRERHESFEAVEKFGRHAFGQNMDLAAMNHPMPDPGQGRAAQMGFGPIDHGLEDHVERGVRINPGLFIDHRPGPVPPVEARRKPDRFDLAVQHRGQDASGQGEQRDLQTGGSGVDGQKRRGHAIRRPTPPGRPPVADGRSAPPPRRTPCACVRRPPGWSG